jgi:hypothetical protein
VTNTRRIFTALSASNHPDPKFWLGLRHREQGTTKERQTGSRYSPTWFSVQEGYLSKGTRGPSRQWSGMAQELNLACKQGPEELEIG